MVCIVLTIGGEGEAPLSMIDLRRAKVYPLQTSSGRRVEIKVPP